MKIDLIPVLHIRPSLNDIPAPAEHPFWEHTELWEQYTRKALIHEGYSIRMETYLTGFPFYSISSLLEEDVTKIVIEHTEGLRTGQFKTPDIISLDGGYVLKKNGKDKFFPQCCAELCDIHYWRSLAKGIVDQPHEGHPSPSVEIHKGIITFEFSEEGQGEHFSPPPAEKILQVEQSELQIAVKQAESDLHEFAELLKKINLRSNLGIANIDQMLIWGQTPH
ncbi:hypothetical protein LZZ85_16970 [Terrimonas sp. NA20]|uniref:Uncharacterized protein n=1 Tax=Terrimonas ginsenosidimutans TaxID=2908004 RepID=A0ABS9KUL8_9BACT|nr:hypothetical protein [Terrimonas ginsenosidimutans]MCG2615992.1 hypothetical protein [Terrimonas ginsenosidimutans]